MIETKNGYVYAYVVYQAIEDNECFLGHNGSFVTEFGDAKFFPTKDFAIQAGRASCEEIGEDWDELFQYEFMKVLPVKCKIPENGGV